MAYSGGGFERVGGRHGRGGEEHAGDAVLIFVTEDFLPKLQVKREVSEAPDAISVLKLNAYRRFYTGIYPILQDETASLGSDSLGTETMIVLRAGRKNYHLVKVV